MTNYQQPVDTKLVLAKRKMREKMAARKRSDPKLAMAISQRMVRSAFSKCKFLPQDALKELLTADVIEDELREATGEYPDHELVDHILTRAQRTFAILASRGTIAKADGLFAFQFDDKLLPVVMKGKTLISLSGQPQDDGAWEFFDDWTWGEKNNFCTDQMPFLPKTFHKDSDMEDLIQGRPLPFLTFRTLGDGGSFSILHRGTVHHAHHPVPGVSTCHTKMKWIPADACRVILRSRSRSYTTRQMEHTTKNFKHYEKHGK